MNRGYSELYQSIKMEIRDEDAQYTWTVMLYLCLASPWVWGLSMVIENPNQWYLILQVSFSMTLVIGFIAFVIWLARTAWSGSQDPTKYVNVLAVRLLVKFQHPYDNRRGLSYKDLARIRELAEVEQNAADWRGNFVSILIMSVLVGTLVFFLDPPQRFNQIIYDVNHYFETILEIDGSLSQPPTFDPESRSTPRLIFDAFSVGVFFALIFLLLFQLARYFNTFLATEPRNQLVQMACLESMVLLEDNGLAEKEELTMSEKQFLAGLLGFQLRAGEDITLFLYSMEGTPWFIDDLQTLEKQKRWREILGKLKTSAGRFLHHMKRAIKKIVKWVNL